MLLRIGVSNFHSIRDYAELSLVASDAIKDNGPALLDGPGRTRVLPFLLIYGANAAGKSALFNVLGMISRHVRQSFAAREPGARIPYAPFALDPASATGPTLLDCDFVVGGTRYHYGFEFTATEYQREWLYSFPENHRRTLFYRSAPKSIEFGPSLKGRNRALAEFTRPNSLFLSTAAQNDHAQLRPVHAWLSNQISGMSPGLNNDDLQQRMAKGLDERIVPFLLHADTGIRNAVVRSEQPPESIKALHRSLVDVVKEHQLEEGVAVELLPPHDNARVALAHAAPDGATVELPFTAESRGTRRLIDILMRALKTIDRGGVLFIDELDAGLHTLLAMKLLELFADPEINRHGAQLIATTHDTNILCSRQVRRDQVWFVEKDAEGASSVYPLTDIRTRNTDNLEKGYLQGRFGAVPFLGSARELLDAGVH